MSYARGPTDDSLFRTPYQAPPWSGSSPGLSSAWPELPEVRAGESRSGAPSSTRLPNGLRGYPLLMSVFFVTFLVFLLYLQTRSDIGENGTLRSVSDLFVLFGSAVCALTCWLTASRLRRMRSSVGVLAGRAWLGWVCLGTAALTYSVGQGIWTWFDGHYTSAQLPFPAIYDPFYLAVYPFSWVGIALLIPRGSTAAGRTRLLLDAGIAVASALAITWYFILGPTVSSLMGPPIEKVVALAYPLGDLSLCVAAALLLFGPSGVPAFAGSLGRLAIGVTWLALTDSLYGYLQLQGTYHTGLPQDIGWPMSWLFVGWAALVYPAAVSRLAGRRISQQQLVGNVRLNTTGAAVRAITPIVLAIVTCTVLLLVVAVRDSSLLLQVVIVCAGLILLPVIRQLLTLIDNLILNERLRMALGQSQQAYQQSQRALVATTDRAERYDVLREGIENLQAVHAQLARGDLSVRARVHGPLAPVAQSLNLLIERFGRWVQFAQMNQVMEGEADQLRHALDELSEGQLGSLPANRSSFATGGALIAAGNLQRQLSLHFGRLRETVTQVGRSWSSLSQRVQATRQATHRDATSSAQQEVETLHEALAEVERGLSANQALLQQLWRETNAYVQGSNAVPTNRASGVGAGEILYGPGQRP